MDKVKDNREERIYEKHFGTNAELGYIRHGKEDTIKAMREYAAEGNKEDAIGFAEWAFGDDINPFVFSKGRWIQACGNSTSWSTEQLYEMYLNQKV